MIQIVNDSESFDREIFGVAFKLRRISNNKHEEIRKKHVSVTSDLMGKAEEIEDHKAIFNEKLDYCILDWDKTQVVDSVTGEQLECNSLNKKRLPESVKLEIAKIVQSVEINKFDIQKKT